MKKWGDCPGDRKQIYVGYDAGPFYQQMVDKRWAGLEGQVERAADPGSNRAWRAAKIET